MNSTPGFRRIYASAFVAAPIFWFALRVAGLARCLAWIRPRTNKRSAMQLSELQEIAGLVNAAVTRAMGPRQCLTRSLVLLWLLARRGVTSHLRIGVRKHDGHLLAHAWVECNGVPLNDDAAFVSDYLPFDGPLPAGAFRE